MKKITLKNLLFLVGFIAILFTSCNKNELIYEKNSLNLFDNSFDNITNYPSPSSLTYSRANGDRVTQNVFPGQIIILASSSASSNSVSELINQNHGEISAQIPSIGLYLANVSQEYLTSFFVAIYRSDLVVDAFPNNVVYGKGLQAQEGIISIEGDKNSLIQTIDLSAAIGFDNVYHKDAVAMVAANGELSVNINDVTVYNKETQYAGADMYKSMQKMLEILNYSYQNNLPVIINISMGGDDEIIDDNYYFYKRFADVLQAVETQIPDILDGAVVFLSEANVGRDETDIFNQLQDEFKDSPIWDHLYFVGSQMPNLCEMGYASIGTKNVLSAPACDVLIPGMNYNKTVNGNSFSTPAISNLVGQTYNLLKEQNNKMGVSEITSKLWKYQFDNNGYFPSPQQLHNTCAGITEPEATYDGTWNGTFHYTVTIPNDSSLPTIIDTIFTLNITMEKSVSSPAQTKMLTITSVTCCDPAFGAISPIVPVSSGSFALLPANFGSSSKTGMAIKIIFPNGSRIVTNDLMDGSFIVDANGKIISSTPIVSYYAFIGYGEDDGNGPGGYSVRWCKFNSWSFLRN